MGVNSHLCYNEFKSNINSFSSEASFIKMLLDFYLSNHMLALNRITIMNMGYTGSTFIEHV